MEEIRVLHIPCNVPYIQKLKKTGYIRIVNTFNTPSFSWICNQAENVSWFQTFDVCHIHFGFEFEAYETVESAIHLLKKNAKPVIFTIHELSSVHGVSQDVYEKYVKLICEHSTGLITLTNAAKYKFEGIYGKSLMLKVIPHGRVIDFTNVPIREPSRTKTVLLYGSLRKNRDVLTSSINLALASSTQWKLRLVTRPFTGVQLQDRILQTVLGLHSTGSLNVETTLPMLDSKIAQMVSSADVLVLPYLEAGHSGQLELAFDCGTPVVYTNVGFLSDQMNFWPNQFHPNTSIADWSDGKTWQYQERLLSAVRKAINSEQDDRLTLERERFRSAEHEKIIEEHRQIYEMAIKQT